MKARVSSFVNSLTELDAALTKAIASTSLPTPFEFLLWPGALIFGWRGVLGFVLPLLWLSFGTKGMLLGLIGGACGQLVNRTIKLLVRRPRPPTPFPFPKRTFHVRVPKLGDDGDAPSFPSGDSMAAGFVGATVFINSGGSLFSFIFPIIGCIGRVYFHCHYVCDTLVGAAIGWFSVHFVCLGYGGKEQVEPFHILPLIPVFIFWMKFGQVILRYFSCI